MIYGKNTATFCERRFDPFDHEKECKPLPPLTAEEKEVVEKNRALVHQYLPELLPWMNALHEAHMLPGWRGVENVVIFDKGNNHGNA